MILALDLSPPDNFAQPFDQVGKQSCHCEGCYESVRIRLDLWVIVEDRISAHNAERAARCGDQEETALSGQADHRADLPLCRASAILSIAQNSATPKPPAPECSSPF